MLNFFLGHKDMTGVTGVSQLGGMSVTQHQCVVAVIHKKNDNHMQLVVERWVKQNNEDVLKLFLAEFGGRKIGYMPIDQDEEEFDIGIGAVKYQQMTKPIESLLQPQIWRLSRTKVECIWKTIELEADERDDYPQLYSALGVDSVGVSKKPFYKTNHPLLITLRNMDALLFDKLYTHCKAASNAETPLKLFDQIVQDNCHWKTAEGMAKILPRLKEKSKKELEKEFKEKFEKWFKEKFEKKLSEKELKGRLEKKLSGKEFKEMLEKANARHQNFIKAFKEFESFANSIISHPELKKIHTDWVYKAGYTKYHVYTSPSIEVLAYWIGIYYLMKTIMIDPNHQYKIELIELKPHNCDTWATEKAKAMGADVNELAIKIISLPIERCIRNSQLRENIEWVAEIMSDAYNLATNLREKCVCPILAGIGAVTYLNRNLLLAYAKRIFWPVINLSDLHRSKLCNVSESESIICSPKEEHSDADKAVVDN